MSAGAGPRPGELDLRAEPSSSSASRSRTASARPARNPCPVSVAPGGSQAVDRHRPPRHARPGHNGLHASSARRREALAPRPGELDLHAEPSSSSASRSRTASAHPPRGIRARRPVSVAPLGGGQAVDRHRPPRHARRGRNDLHASTRLALATKRTRSHAEPRSCSEVARCVRTSPARNPCPPPGLRLPPAATRRPVPTGRCVTRAAGASVCTPPPPSTRGAGPPPRRTRSPRRTVVQFSVEVAQRVRTSPARNPCPPPGLRLPPAAARRPIPTGHRVTRAAGASVCTPPPTVDAAGGASRPGELDPRAELPSCSASRSRQRVRTSPARNPAQPRLPRLPAARVTSAARPLVRLASGAAGRVPGPNERARRIPPTRNASEVRGRISRPGRAHLQEDPASDYREPPAARLRRRWPHPACRRPRFGSAPVAARLYTAVPPSKGLCTPRPPRLSTWV
jgi:hypothetical protein